MTLLRNKRGQFISGKRPEWMKVKISKALTGKKKKKRSGEHSKRLSNALKGRTFSERHKRNLSKALKGKKLSKEHTRKMSEVMKGKKNPNWKGGITSKNQQERGSAKTREWRMAVFLRDNFTCQFCGARCHRGLGKSVFLVAHHIKSWARHKSLRYDIDNGITLCEDCHSLVHKKDSLNSER